MIIDMTLIFNIFIFKNTNLLPDSEGNVHMPVGEIVF